MYTKHFDKGNKATKKDVAHIVDGTKLSSYWVGYLYANANYMVVKNQIRGMRVVCTSDEKEHLHQLSTYLGYNANPIRTNKTSTNLILSIYSVDLVGYLSAIGLAQHMQDRALLDRSYASNHDFWRGYCDGNGMLYGETVDDIQFRVQANDALMDKWVAFTGRADYTMLHHKSHQEWITTGQTAQDIVQSVYANPVLVSPRMWNVAYHHLTREQQATDGILV